jgi:hypothetical protein
VVFALFLVPALLAAACSSNGPGGGHATGPEAAEARIVVRADEVLGPFDRRLLGTNVPAWLLPELVADQGFIDVTKASGTTLLRMPGGSWSNQYDWSGCELRDPERCDWTWALRPSEFIALIEATGLPAMWTASINGTAEEAAAAVAFFNGAVDDERVIGVDRNGRDWMTVGHWARLRAERGFPEPVSIRYWEVGNEVYGAIREAGSSCASWGWEDVWTCEGTEYVAGTDDHDGYLRFREAMRGVDADIVVGAVGVGDRGGWNDWDDDVMETAGGAIDFYVVHHYGSNGDVPADEVLDGPRAHWPAITDDVREGYADHGIGDVPIAVTEHNLVAFIDGDDDRLMTTAVNGFYLAETIGQMAINGVAIANQWNLANGRAENGSDYGLVNAQTHERSPAYYAMVLWSRFGDELVAVDARGGNDALLLYGGRRADGSVQLLVLNPSSAPVRATISVEVGTQPEASTGASPPSGPSAVRADVVAAESLLSTDVTFNGASTPSRELTEPAQVLVPDELGELHHDFPAYSITLLSWSPPS